MTTLDQYQDHKKKVFDYLRVDEFIKGIIEARALGTAFELGIIDYLIENQDCALDELKRHFQLEGQGLRLLIDLLKANRVVEENHGEIRLSRKFIKALPYRDLLIAKLEFVNFVTPDFTDLFTALIRNPDQFNQNARVLDLFGYNRCYDYSPGNYDLTERWVRITTSLTRYEALVCMEYHDFARHRRILDIGGNSGEFALQICRKYPGISATVFDLPLVCDIGKEHVCSEPEAGRIAFVKGNALKNILPKGFDLIIFKSMLHDWPEREAKRLIVSAAQSLMQGGTLLIFERGPLDLGERTTPHSILPFLLFFRSFRSPLMYEDQLMESGFQDIKVQKIDLEMPFFLVTAIKKM
jgi:ubiquinone/menaquinone biosynthesis C-methylase UbiE